MSHPRPLDSPHLRGRTHHNQLLRTPGGRGQSDIIAIVLLIGLTVISVTAILVIGASALTDYQSQSEIDRAEHAITQLDSKISLVAHGPAVSQRTTVPIESHGTHLHVDDTAGWMRIDQVDDGDTVLEIMNVTMGAVVYEHPTRPDTIAYQGGGVWKAADGGSTMISPPEFHYRTTGDGHPTLTLPLVQIRGAESLSSNVVIRQDDPVIPEYPIQGNASRSNPLTEGEVVVTVHSDYYLAWGHFFESRTGGSVEFNHSADIVTITLTTDDIHQPIEDGFTVGAGDALRFTGGGQGALIDSYNSTIGTYADSKTDNGRLKSAGDIDMSGTVTIKGDVYSGESVEVGGNADVTGTVFWTTGYEEPQQGGPDNEQIDGVEAPPSVGNIVDNEIDLLSADNDNNDTTSIENNEIQWTDSAANLTGSGDYYLTNGDFDGKHLTLNVSDGEEVVIGVDDDLNLGKDGRIEIVGNGSAEFYVTGDILLDRNATISVPFERSPNLWIYGTENADIIMDGSSGEPINVTGVIYAPTGQTGSGEIDLRFATVRGAIVGGPADIHQGVSIHQDLALKDHPPFPDNLLIPRLHFLHISVNPVTITSV